MGPWPKTLHCTFYTRISLAKLLDELPINFSSCKLILSTGNFTTYGGFLISAKFTSMLPSTVSLTSRLYYAHYKICDDAARNRPLDAKISPYVVLLLSPPRPWGQVGLSVTFNSPLSYHHYILILISYEADWFKDKAEVKSPLVSTQNDTRRY